MKLQKRLAIMASTAVLTVGGLGAVTTSAASAFTPIAFSQPPSPSSTAQKPSPTRDQAQSANRSTTRNTTRNTTARKVSPWKPAVGGSWQIQFTGSQDINMNVQAYELDGFDTTAGTIRALRARGRHAICYISAGSWENWRPDAARYPRRALGNSNGWPGERWIDIRQTSVLKPILDKRLDMCRSKGFQAVDFDNVDGYTQNTGFPLTGADQLVFNRWIAAEAHAYGLSVGLKNDLDQIPNLVGSYDFAVNEQCHQYNECAALRPFIRAGKAVLQIEYAGDPSRFCRIARKSGLSTLLKREDLSAWRQAC